jgi:zinc transporter ZupT
MIDGYSVQTIIFAFALTVFAGLSTGIGSAVAYFAKRTNVRFLSVALGFSAGVMIYISLVEIFHKALEHCRTPRSRRWILDGQCRVFRRNGVHRFD